MTPRVQDLIFMTYFELVPAEAFLREGLCCCFLLHFPAIICAPTKDIYTKDVHGKISDSASEGQIISAFLKNIIDI